jgi:predicted site-specific integrase-resolvase
MRKQKIHGYSAPGAEKKWYSLSDLSERWGVSTVTVRRWHRMRRLKANIFSTTAVRFSNEEVLRFEKETAV